MKKILEYFVDVFFFIYTTVVMILLFAIFGFLFTIVYFGSYAADAIDYLIFSKKRDGMSENKKE